MGVGEKWGWKDRRRGPSEDSSSPAELKLQVPFQKGDGGEMGVGAGYRVCQQVCPL